MDPSVKDQVITLARQDPFLTVEELAQSIGTTTRYVRTILSEANLSLNQMRKDYARSLEMRLGERAKKQKFVFQQDLQIKKVSAKDLPESPPQWQDKELFQIAQLHKAGDVSSYTQLITPLPLTIIKEYSSLRDLLPLPKKDVVVLEQRVEFVLAPSELRKAFKWSHEIQVLKLSTILHNQNKPVGLEIQWLAPEGLVLALTPNEGELKVLLSG